MLIALVRSPEAPICSLDKTWNRRFQESRNAASKAHKNHRCRDPTGKDRHRAQGYLAQHKSHFFMEKDMEGEVIDYVAATTGKLKIVPDGDAKTALAKDYEAMLADDVMVGDALSFEELLEACTDLESEVNRATINRK